MPIYEYRCQGCQRRVELLLRNSNAVPSCPHCGSSELKRIMSRFAHHLTEKDRLAAINTGKPLGEDYYRDERNIGLHAKKRMMELGYNPGSDFDAVIEKAKQETKEKLSE